jgi:hypothetical protein
MGATHEQTNVLGCVLLEGVRGERDTKGERGSVGTGGRKRLEDDASLGVLVGRGIGRLRRNLLQAWTSVRSAPSWSTRDYLHSRATAPRRLRSFMFPVQPRLSGQFQGRDWGQKDWTSFLTRTSSGGRRGYNKHLQDGPGKARRTMSFLDSAVIPRNRPRKRSPGQGKDAPPVAVGPRQNGGVVVCRMEGKILSACGDYSLCNMEDGISMLAERGPGYEGATEPNKLEKDAAGVGIPQEMPGEDGGATEGGRGAEDGAI